ncbi:hypothetical protein ES702_07396 [subsurface metagenome]
MLSQSLKLKDCRFWKKSRCSCPERINKASKRDGVVVTSRFCHGGQRASRCKDFSARETVPTRWAKSYQLDIFGERG